MKKYFLKADGTPLRRQWHGKMRAATLQLVDGSGCVVETERRAALTTNGRMTRAQSSYMCRKLIEKGKALFLWNLNWHPRDSSVEDAEQAGR